MNSPDTARLLEETGKLSEKLNFRTALVGGPVRDMLLGRAVEEIDCVVEGGVSRLGKDLAKRLNGRLTEHHRFLTCRVELPDGNHIDLATARSETYARPGALPRVSPAAIEDDLKRRDFSVNALAVCVNPREFGVLLDPHGGAADLKKKSLRVLHDRSFTDDPTRVLRGIRFASRYGFGWERRTKKLLLDALDAGCLDTVSGERIKKEWRSLLSEETRPTPMRALRDFGIAGRLADGLSFSTRLAASPEKMREIMQQPGVPPAEPWLIYTMALIEEADKKTALAFMERLSFTKREKKIVSQGTFLSPPVRRAARDAAVRLGDLHRMLTEIEKEAAVFILVSETAAGARDRLKMCMAASPLLISGGDLRALGFAPSPAFREALDEALKLKIEGKIRTREQELNVAKRILEAEKSLKVQR